MSVVFGTGAQVDINTVRARLSQGSGDIRYLSSLCGFGTPDQFSDWWNVNFFAYVYLTQGEGYIWDGCQGRDHWCWLEGTTEDGGFLNAFGGGSTYNTERGFNNGTFLTFGYGYSYSYLQPYSGFMIASASNNDYNCRAFYVDVLELYSYNTVAGNYFAYAGGYQETRYYSNVGFQNYRYFYARLILWY